MAILVTGLWMIRIQVVSGWCTTCAAKARRFRCNWPRKRSAHRDQCSLTWLLATVYRASLIQWRDAIAIAIEKNIDENVRNVCPCPCRCLCWCRWRWMSMRLQLSEWFHTSSGGRVDRFNSSINQPAEWSGSKSSSNRLSMLWESRTRQTGRTKDREKEGKKERKKEKKRNYERSFFSVVCGFSRSNRTLATASLLVTTLIIVCIAGWTCSSNQFSSSLTNHYCRMAPQ